MFTYFFLYIENNMAAAWIVCLFFASMPIGNEILALGTWNFFKDTDHKQSYKF
jgi:hypothetical protein